MWQCHYTTVCVPREDETLARSGEWFNLRIVVSTYEKQTGKHCFHAGQADVCVPVCVHIADGYTVGRGQCDASGMCLSWSLVVLAGSHERTRMAFSGTRLWGHLCVAILRSHLTLRMHSFQDGGMLDADSWREPACPPLSLGCAKVSFFIRCMFHTMGKPSRHACGSALRHTSCRLQDRGCVLGNLR